MVLSGQKKQKGFSLIELITVVAIIGISAGIAIPSIISWLPNYRLRGATADLYVNFQKARTEAIKRQARCYIIFDSATSYRVFADLDANGELNGSDPVIEQVNLLQSYLGITIVANTFDTNGDGLRVGGYSPRGLGVNADGGFGGGTVTLQNQNNRQRQVVMSSTGGVRVTE